MTGKVLRASFPSISYCFILNGLFLVFLFTSLFFLFTLKADFLIFHFYFTFDENEGSSSFDHISPS